MYLQHYDPPAEGKQKIFWRQINSAKPFHWTCSETLEHWSCYRAHFSERDGNILIGTSWKALPHWKPVRRAHPLLRQLQPHQNPLMNLASDISLVFTLVQPQSRNNSKPYIQVSCMDHSVWGQLSLFTRADTWGGIVLFQSFSHFTNIKAVLCNFADLSHLCKGKMLRIQRIEKFCFF